MALAALAGCTKVGTQSAQGGNAFTQHGVLRYAENADPRNLNPLLAASAVTADLGGFIYSYAVRYDEKGTPFPDALRELPSVENGDVSKDGLTLKYKLRPGIKWHDGQELTCQDLRFTWQAVMNPKNNVNVTDGYRDMKEIDCRDPLVALVHMKKVYAPFLQQFWSPAGNTPILPAHLLAQYNDAKGSLNTAQYNSAPVGSGPFTFVSWERGSQIKLAAFPGYFMGKPKLNEEIFKIMPDANTLLTQLKTHEIDMIARGAASKWPEYQQIPGVVAIDPPTFQFAHIDFNLKRPMFADVRVRKALAYATDTHGILTKLRHGIGDAAPADQSPVLSWAYDPNVEKHDYDPAKARALLDEAGWKVGPDGIRVKDGRRLQFNYSTQTEATGGIAMQTLIMRDWHDIGVDAQAKNYPTSLFFENSATGIVQGGHYDVAAFSWVGSTDPDDSQIYSADNMAPRGQNSLFWNDRRATDAMNDALATVDRERRKKDYFVVQEELAGQVPTIVLYFAREPWVYNSDLKHFSVGAGQNPFWNPWEYEI